MSILLKLKHWQIFTAMILLPILVQIAAIAITSANQDPTAVFIALPAIMIITMGLFFGWFYALGTGLYKKLPPSLTMNIKLFKALLFIPVVYFVIFFWLIYTMVSQTSAGREPDPSMFMV